MKKDIENKSIITELYKMDKSTLRRYCISLLRDNARYYRLSIKNRK